MKDQLTILGIGAGGRESALAASLAASHRVREQQWAPGNAGIGQATACVNIAADNIDELCRFAQAKTPDLIVVGPEAPLVAGIADRLRRLKLRCFGPTARGAKIEGSKAWCKRFLARHGIPTAPFRVFLSAAAAKAHLRKCRFPVVVKADGLCAGKGVTVAQTVEEASAAVDRCLIDRQFGTAGAPVIIEDCLVGRECSITVLTDGRIIVPLATAMDYKRAGDGDIGPMTGGVGCISPHPALTAAEEQAILERIVSPTLGGLQAENITYAGVFYFGLMMTANGPQVLEINCRFGDPESQVILPRLQSDLAELLYTATGSLGHISPLSWSDDVAVCVTLYSDGYPGKYNTGFTIYGLEEAAACEGVRIFHAGTVEDGRGIKTAGGRVLHIVALGPTQAEARKCAYAAASKIRFTGIRYRTDIGVEVTATA